MLIAAERERDALELRKTGMTYEQIAKKLEMSSTGAYKCVSRALERLEAETGEKANEVRKLELERLDVMLAGVWKKAQAGNVYAVDRVLRIQERRSKYLGLDAQEESQVLAPPVINFVGLGEARPGNKPEDVE